MNRIDPSRRDLGRLVLGATLAAALPRRARAAAGPPSRIAVIDYGLAQALMMIGVDPIAVMAVADWKTWVVEPALPPGTADLGATLEPNFERLAALKPDLILTTDYVALAEPTLRTIAPVERLTVYGADTGAPLPRSVEVTRRLGDITGRRAEAEAAIAAFDAEIAAIGARLRERARRPMLFAWFLDPRHLRVYGDAGLYGNVLARLGIANAWTSPGNYWGFDTVALEDLAGVGEVDFVAMEPVLPDIWPTLAVSPLWTALPFVRAGRVHVMPNALTFGTLPAALRFARLVDALPLERAA